VRGELEISRVGAVSCTFSRIRGWRPPPPLVLVSSPFSRPWRDEAAATSLSFSFPSPLLSPPRAKSPPEHFLVYCLPHKRNYGSIPTSALSLLFFFPPSFFAAAEALPFFSGKSEEKDESERSPLFLLPLFFHAGPFSPSSEKKMETDPPFPPFPLPTLSAN